MGPAEPVSVGISIADERHARRIEAVLRALGYSVERQADGSSLDMQTDRLASRFELTPRERELLHLVIGGRNNEEAAIAMGISRHTVAWHVRNILRKTGTASREELVPLLFNPSAL